MKVLDKWKNYQAAEVLSENDVNGNRLISLFASDYKKITGSDLCPSCNGFEEKFKNFIKKLEDMSNSDLKNSGYVLKAMYDNITLHGSAVYYNNVTLTDEKAQELIANHPKGVDLFERIPELSNESAELVNNSDEQVNIFGKEMSLEEVKNAFKTAGIDTRANSAKGFQFKLEKLTEDQKKALETVVSNIEIGTDISDLPALVESNNQTLIVNDNG